MVFRIATIVMIVCCGLLYAQEQRVSDPQGFVSLVPHENWQAGDSTYAEEIFGRRPNPFTRAIGADFSRPGILLFKFAGAKELIPNVQITISDVGGLQVNDESMDQIRRNIESSYSINIGSSFRLFMLEREDVAGLHTIKLTGVYRWRTNNIRIMQYLIPGNDHLYTFTYTSREREFSSHLPEVQEMLSSISLRDAPLYLDWLWNIGKTILLIGLVIAIVIGILYANSVKPEKGYVALALTPSKKSGSRSAPSPRSDPFARKK